MAFRFRLESVLHYRRQLEAALQLQLARLEQARRAEQQVLDGLRAQKEWQMDNLLSQQQEGPRLDVPRLSQGLAYVEKLEGNMQEQVEVLAALAAQIEKKRGEVTKAMQDRKALENLKERERRRFFEWLNRVEGRLLDEAATTQHNRRLRAAAEEGDSFAKQ